MSTEDTYPDENEEEEKSRYIMFFIHDDDFSFKTFLGKTKEEIEETAVLAFKMQFLDLINKMVARVEQDENEATMAASKVFVQKYRDLVGQYRNEVGDNYPCVNAVNCPLD